MLFGSFDFIKTPVVLNLIIVADVKVLELNMIMHHLSLSYFPTSGIAFPVSSTSMHQLPTIVILDDLTLFQLFLFEFVFNLGF